MKEPSLVSVIIPCYNQAQYLQDALYSVLAQTYKYWECIIVNDGSADNTEEVALDWCNKDSRFKYCKKVNGGLSSARNLGIINSSGEFILPLDADDKIADTYIEKAVYMLESGFDIGVVTTNQVMSFGAKNGLEGNAREGGTELFIGHYNNQVSCSMFRKVVWEACGGYDEKMREGFEDWDFWIRLTDKGLKIATIKEPLFFYRIKEESMWTTCERKKPQLIKYMVEKNKAIYWKYISEAIVSREEVILELRTQIQNLQNSLEICEKHFHSIRFRKLSQVVSKLRDIFKSK